LSNSVKSWAPGFTVAKTEETVFFRAKGNYNQNVCDSDEISRTLSIISLTKIPDEKITYEYFAAESYFNVTVEETYETENADQKFILSTSGVEREMNGRTYQYVFSGAPTINFNVKAVGGYFGESVGGIDKYYVTSSPSSTKTMTVFGVPSVNVVKLVEDSYRVDFGVQDGVTQLEYEITFILDGEEEIQPDTTQQASIIISSSEFSSREATGFKIKARALGEVENDTYDSKWSSMVITYLN
ncbi:MAG: hypothetical protein GXY10_05575, partial [Clostridiales bacterium]|nr:hypothetical protein [Clostridiales bacterium]